MLQHKTAEDFVIATGVSHSVREFVVAAFQHVGVDIVYVIVGFSVSSVSLIFVWYLILLV